MKATELQINDMVIYDGKPYGVLGIDKTSSCNVILDMGKKWLDDQTVIESAITPIPLTEKILKANGFSVGRNFLSQYLFMQFDWYNDYVHPLLWKVHIANEETDVFKHSVLDIRIHYVHQLQHALRLAGLADLANNFKLE